MCFIPEFRAENIYKTDFVQLYGLGIRFIIFDVDNTLVPYSLNSAPDELKALIAELRQAGFEMCILSNGHSERAGKIAGELGMTFEGDAFKPSQRGFKRVFQKFNLEPERVLIIGDQLFTDIWGGRLAKIHTLLVTPFELSDEPGFVKFKRILEKLLKSRITKAENIGV